MLVLSRKRGERIRVRNKETNETIWLTLVEIDRNKIRIGFELPKIFEVLREEVIGRNSPSK